MESNGTLGMALDRIITKNSHNVSLAHGSSHSSLEVYLGRAYSLSLLVLTVFSLVENVFFVLLTIGPLHRVCYLRRRRRDFVFLTRNNVNITNLAFSLQITAMGYQKPIVAHPPTDKSAIRTSYRFRCISTMSTETSCVSSMHKFTRYFFGSLCVSITLLMCVTLINVLIEGTVSLAKKQNTAHCLVANISHSALLMVMSFSLVQLTMDRLVAICVPFRYCHLVSTWRCVYAIAIGWSVSVVFAFVPQMHIGFKLNHMNRCLRHCFIVNIHGSGGFYVYAYAFMALAYVAPLCFIILAYTRIHLLVKRSAVAHSENHLRVPNKPNTSIFTLRNQHVGCVNCQNACVGAPSSSIRSPTRVSGGSRTSRPSDDADSRTSRESVSREEAPFLIDSHGKEKAAKSAMWIVFSFYGLMLPYMCVIFYQTIVPTCQDIRRTWVDLAECGSIILAYMSTVITPIIYAVRDGVLRRRLRSFLLNLTSVCKKKRIPDLPIRR